MTILMNSKQLRLPIEQVPMGARPWNGDPDGLDCNFNCLTECPMIAFGMLCIYDDPDVTAEIMRYIHAFDIPSEFDHDIWRDTHEEQVHPEPEDPTTTRCPRCYSTQVEQDDQYIWCESCHFNETLDTVD